ncbi:molybdate ABC transporter substrate-binding protein [Actinoallomurus rhizosphaericola]|uniref:molybdate ABC transporter substrate-binding protein n=1 Tax=Actinoallomurus rhizosphaericola TaxID=2952536 RepID=UPI0020916109|nr:molybdate ABC transporter substrate-binding protein [Actinoallomurus rhizosphaericola]MCO5992331.1 molybdate ABC transporter substrate-binding protein [Actinoallomurus rhizosphaericola]
MPPMPRVAALAAVALALSGCGIASGDERITLNVLAASSLTEAFEELGTAYGAAAKNVTVRFEFAGSQDLAMDVEEREPADVLATADQASMDTVADRVTGRRAFAYNSMTIAVAPGNPRHVQGLASLADRRLRVVLGGPIVPVGRYAAQVLAKAGVVVRPRSEEADARTVLTRVRTGAADAGIVYVTDMRSAGIAATSVPIPAQQNVTATYFAAALRASGHEEAAKDFVAWLRSPTATAILRKYGFPTP